MTYQSLNTSGLNSADELVDGKGLRTGLHERREVAGVDGGGEEYLTFVVASGEENQEVVARWQHRRKSSVPEAEYVSLSAWLFQLVSSSEFRIRCEKWPEYRSPLP
jgi:hypothetical protein